ncbi:MAG: hypothetical protein JW965_00070 [Bacteroidales bacterium]|nr:hypothetical protein [Bacteroidales bacterium]
MQWYILISLGALAICLLSCLYHFFRLVRYGAPKDFSHKLGNTGAAIKYSFTGAMSPLKKESAYLHLPTYSAGMFYHIGTFLTIIVFLLQLTVIRFPVVLTYIFAFILILSAISGTGILIKRIVVRRLRKLSCPDDYISNIMVTLFQFITAFLLTGLIYQSVYYIAAAILLLYIPVGKLRHLVYFFAARYQLGYFYGWRGSWPPSKKY